MNWGSSLKTCLLYSSETSDRTRQELPDPVAGFGEPADPPTQ